MRQAVPVSDEWVQAPLKDANWVATARQRLQSLGWLMKCMKEPLSRLANRGEQTRGAFLHPLQEATTQFSVDLEASSHDQSLSSL